GGDRALLAEHGLGADLDQPLMTADLGPVADPDEATEVDPPPRRDLDLEPATEEDEAVGAPAAPRRGQQAAPGVAPGERPVAPVEHPLSGEEADHGGAL